MRGVELKCDRCKGGGVDLGPRPIDAFAVACWYCRGHGGMTAREVSTECDVSEKIARRILRGTWKPKTARQLNRVLDAILSRASYIERAGHA